MGENPRTRQGDYDEHENVMDIKIERVAARCMLIYTSKKL